MKSLFEQLGGTYHWEGDYLIPDLELPDEGKRPIGIWGQRHERWLKQEHRALYRNLMFTYKLHEHLVDVDERAARMFTQLTEEMRHNFRHAALSSLAGVSPPASLRLA